MTDTKACRECGNAFEKSPADTTVYCPDCRKRRRRDARITGAKDSILAGGRTKRFCPCGKTVLIDGFGHPTGNRCPRKCGS